MNPDAPLTPREELEIRITALLMGQLPPEEAAELLRQIAADPELTALYGRMRHAVELLREARSLPGQAAPEIPLQLSTERREKLLAKFRGIQALPSPKAVLAPRRSKKQPIRWVPTVIAASAIFVVGGALLMPNLLKSRHRAQASSELRDLSAIDAAIEAGKFETESALAQERGADGEVTSRFRIAQDGGEQSAPAGGEGKSALAAGWASQAGAVRSSRPTSALYLPKVEQSLAQNDLDGTKPGGNVVSDALHTDLPTGGAPASVQRGIPPLVISPEPSAPKRPIIALGRQPESGAKVAAAATPSEPAGGGEHWKFNQAAGGRATKDSQSTGTGTFAVNGHVANSDFIPEAPKPVALASAPVDAMAREKRLADSMAAEQSDTPHALSQQESGRIVNGGTSSNTTAPPPASGPVGATATASFAWAVDKKESGEKEVQAIAERELQRRKEDALANKDFSSLGRYELADTEAQKELNVDRYNKAAEKRRQSVVDARNEFGEVAYNSARSQAIWQESKEGESEERRLKGQKSGIAENSKTASPNAVPPGDSATKQDRVLNDPQSAALPGMAGFDTGVGIANLADEPVALRKQMKSQDFDSNGQADKSARGNTRAEASGKNTFWDTEAAAGQKPAQEGAKQWFGKAPSGDGAAGVSTQSLFTAGGTRGTAPQTNSAKYFFHADGTTLAGEKPVAETVGGTLGLSSGAAVVTGKVAAETRFGATVKGKGEKVAGVLNFSGGAANPAKPSDDYFVDLDFVPQVAEFEGFIDLNSPVINPVPGKLGKSEVSYPVADHRAARALFDNLEDKVTQLDEFAYILPAPGNSTGKTRESLGVTNYNRFDELAAIKLPGLVPAEAKPEAAQPELEELRKTKLEKKVAEPEPPAMPQKTEAPVPQPEVLAKDNAFSTFSLNVSDVSFKLAESALEKNAMPHVESVRVEEFINALDYRDPEPVPGAPLAFTSERARYPFAHNRDLLRLSVKTAAEGRQAGRPLNLTLLVDNSGSMERTDRVAILREALAVLAKQLKPQDKLSVISFSRTPRLWADGVAGDKAGEFTARVSEIRPEGGTDIGAAMDLGYTTALKHYQVGSGNRVVLLTDGAANLGNVDAASLKAKVEAHRKQGVAFDCFGVGWEGYNDDLLEQLSRNGDGRYGFINTPEAAATEFAGALAGALRVAASDVKVQVEFNPRRVISYRQLGYAKHQLKKEQFRDNTVDAAEIGAAEAGNALYTVELNASGVGDIGVVRVRFKVPGTDEYHEREWTVPFNAPAPALEQSSSSLRLAATAGAFGEFLAQTPYAVDVTTDKLLGMINGIPQIYGADPRPGKLEWMIRKVKSVSGR
jgi:Mg-chelatase subunit ChlD